MLTLFIFSVILNKTKKLGGRIMTEEEKSCDIGNCKVSKRLFFSPLFFIQKIDYNKIKRKETSFCPLGETAVVPFESLIKEMF